MRVVATDDGDAEGLRRPGGVKPSAGAEVARSAISGLIESKRSP